MENRHGVRMLHGEVSGGGKPKLTNLIESGEEGGKG